MSICSIWMIGVVGLVVLGHLYLQIAVTWFVFISNEDKFRKSAQLFCVWFVPLLGPVMVGYFQTEEVHMSNFQQSVPKLFIPFLIATGKMHGDSSGNSTAISSESIHDTWTDF